ncbi:MAG: BBP7 family outer membrane beta-barrel protein [Thermoguttaceae bacterium]
METVSLQLIGEDPLISGLLSLKVLHHTLGESESKEKAEGKSETGPVLTRRAILWCRSDMPRTARIAPGAMVFHVLNRATARIGVFAKEKRQRIDENGFTTALVFARWAATVSIGSAAGFRLDLTPAHGQSGAAGIWPGGNNSRYLQLRQSTAVTAPSVHWERRAEFAGGISCPARPTPKSICTTHSVFLRNDYGADTNCWAHSHEMCLIVPGGQWMNSGNLFGAVACAILALATSSAPALGQTDPADGRFLTGNGEDSPPSFSETAAGQWPCAGCCDAGCCQAYCPRWTASADFIILERIGGGHQTLVETVPRSVKLCDLYNTPGTEVLDSSDLQQGFCGGPRVDLIRHGDSGYDLELSYFQIDGWNSYRSVPPDNSPVPNWLVFKAPGDFVQTTDHRDQAMAWRYATKLSNAELNVRWELCSRVTMPAGFRWVDLSEDLQGTLPPERAVPFWDTRTSNNLYGFQIGEDWRISSRGCFSMDGLMKAGIFDNSAVENTGVSIYRTVYGESASTNQAAFLGEIALQCKYQVTERLSLTAGYGAIRLQGVALAPAQIAETLCHGRPVTDVYVRALGVDSGCGVFFHGATVGLEYAF